MLNGKFFTGLPPNMIERGGAVPNRLESHFFWPDDSQAESAADIRVRRRNSVQLQENDRPVYGNQSSVGGVDVNTKKRFSKEFSQSSIQFYDNLNDNNSATKRRPLLRSSIGGKKTELTEKPTATRLELPETVVDEAYTNAKKKQAYVSKIQFYDYVNEDANRNNLRKPKMDMNDKREMELNSKNSPKLQMKHDVRSISEEKEIPKVNNREVNTLERPRQTKEVNVNRAPTKRNNAREDIYRGRSNVSPQRSLTNARTSYDSQYASERARNNEREEIPKRTSSIKSENSNNPRYASDREIYHKPDNSVLTKAGDYHNYEREPEVYEDRRYANRTHENAEVFAEEPQYRRLKNDTKKSSRSQHETRETLGEYNNDYEQEIGGRMKTVRIQSSPPRKHHYYREEYYEDEEPGRGTSSAIEHTKRRSEYSVSDRYEVDLPYVENVEITNNSNNKSKSHINRVTNKLNNELHTRIGSSPPPGPSTNASLAAATTTASMDVNTSQKHLRSSLCFHDGAIIAENDATRSPTSEQPTPRRNIRSLATKRVSVGLPG